MIKDILAALTRDLLADSTSKREALIQDRVVGEVLIRDKTVVLTKEVVGLVMIRGRTVDLIKDQT